MNIPKKDYPRFQGVEVLNKDMADNADIRRAIIKAVPQANAQVKDFAKHFGRNSQRETCKAIFDFLKTQINYRADGSEQVIKLPSALLKTREGDCKSYSLLTSAVLTNLGIPHHFVLTSYNADPTPSHIYVALDDGCIIDAVWGIFDSEKKPTYKYEVKPNGQMKVKTLSGVGSPKQIGNPLVYAALAVAPVVAEAWSKGKKERVTGLGGCGCGIGCAGNCSCGCNKPVGLGALDAASKAYCDRTYPDTGTYAKRAVNKVAREGCYARESALDNAKKNAEAAKKALEKASDYITDLNLKKYTNSAFRTIYLGIIKFNVDGYATQLQNNPAKRSKLEAQFTRWGGDGRNVYEAVKEGAAKKPLNIGFISTIKNNIARVLPKGVKINGIGQTDTTQTMTDEEKKALYAELTKMGFEAKDWSRMTKEEKSAYISKKLTSGSLGAIIRTSVDAGGATAATAVCVPLNVGAAVCTPIGALLGEAIYAQIPDIVDMIVTGDKQFDPVAPQGGDPNRVEIYDGDAGDDKPNNTLLYVAGASVLGFLLYNKFIKK